MNRNDWEQQVHNSNMNVTAKCIALVVGSFGNWTVDKTVEPGASKVAQYAGVTRDTANLYINELVAQGWLKAKGVGQYNTTIYELCEVVADSTGKLARDKRNMNPKSTAALKRGRDIVVADSTGKSEEAVVADTTGLVADTTGSQLPIPEGLVAGSTGSNLSNLELQPNKNLKDTPPGKPVVVDTLPRLEAREDSEDTTTPSLRGTGPSRFFLTPGELQAFLRYTRSLSLEPGAVAEARQLLETTSVSGRDFQDRMETVLTEMGVDIVVW